jgi:hypothetical protein
MFYDVTLEQEIKSLSTLIRVDLQKAPFKKNIGEQGSAFFHFDKV